MRHDIIPVPGYSTNRPRASLLRGAILIRMGSAAALRGRGAAAQGPGGELRYLAASGTCMFSAVMTSTALALAA
jgi:hypothetical protein